MLTKKQALQVKRWLDKFLEERKDEALNGGCPVEKLDMALSKLKRKVLEKRGINADEWAKWEAGIERGENVEVPIGLDTDKVKNLEAENRGIKGLFKKVLNQARPEQIRKELQQDIKTELNSKNKAINNLKMDIELLKAEKEIKEEEDKEFNTLIVENLEKIHKAVEKPQE